MDVVQVDRQVAETDAVVFPEDLVVIARYVNHPGAVLGLPQDGPDDVVLTVRPVQAVAHFPDVDDVADEKKTFAAAVAEKIQEERCLTALEAEVNVRDEDAADSHRSQRTYAVHAALR